MKTRQKTKNCAFLLLSCLLAAGGTLAQTAKGESTEGWYRVHMAIFEHRGDSGEYDELWRSQLQLRYPPKLMRLKTRQQFLADLCNASPTGTASSTAENRLLDILERVDAGEDYPPENSEEYTQARPLDPACKELYPERFPPSADETSAARANAAVASAEALIGGSMAKPEQSGPFVAPVPYVLTPDIGDKEFADMVKKLKGAYRYRVLFSGSWPQKLTSRNDAPPLLVQGGNQIGRHFELEGYIKVALERYLHIDTDLWLSRYSGQTPQATEGYGYGSQVDRINEFPALPTPFPANDPGSAAARMRDQRAAEYQAARQNSENMDYQESATQGNADARPRSNLDILRGQDSSYYVERTVVMRQNRRMRSGEVHYLDHPLFGLLIKVTPLAEEIANKKTAALSR